jgi:hypothetical protein
MSGRWYVAIAVAAALLLAAGYAVVGGGRYEPSRTADPCEPRPFPKPQSGQALVERLTLSVLDGAACQFGVSREAVALAIASDRHRARFTATHDLDDDQIERALRAGIRRALEDAERVQAIDPLVAALLRAAARTFPLDSLIDELHRCCNDPTTRNEMEVSR